MDKNYDNLMEPIIDLIWEPEEENNEAGFEPFQDYIGGICFNCNPPAGFPQHCN